MKKRNLTNTIRLACIAPLAIAGNLYAAQKTSCADKHDGDGNYIGTDCTTTYSGGGGGSPINFSRHYYDQYRASVEHLSGNPFPHELSIPQIEQELEAQYDKTPWSGEQVGDLLQAANNLKQLVNYLILTYDLSPEMVTKLQSAFNQANQIITLLNSGVQITNHLINHEWGYAGSEFATLLAGSLVGLVVGASGSVIVTTTAMLLAGLYVLPRIEDFGDTLLEQYNHEGLLERINIKWDVPNIFELAEDAVEDLYCSSIPPWKREQFPYCSIPPIVLDLDKNGIDFIPLKNSTVMFDVDNDKIDDYVSWPTKGNGVLFADWNGSGIVDRRTEFMFSLFSIKKIASDLEGLRTFDYDDDGDIDKNDNVYEKLFVWDDKNEDGYCTVDEVSSLADLGIELHFKEIKKEKKKAKYKNIKGNKIQDKFSFTMSNDETGKVKTGNAYSVLLRAKLN